MCCVIRSLKGVFWEEGKEREKKAVPPLSTAYGGSRHKEPSAIADAMDEVAASHFISCVSLEDFSGNKKVDAVKN